jgi:HD-like signal output (HDOD) protein
MATSSCSEISMGNSHLDHSVQLADDTAAFERIIATELAGEALELPSFPEVALRVRKALGHAEISIDAVVRMVSAEPSLAVRLLQLANSVALNPHGQRITTLRAAITRIGFNLARSATIAFAMSQMRRAEAWRHLDRRFRELWEQSAALAAIAHALAARVPGVVADQAMLAGMLTSVGRLFVLTRLSRFPLLLNSPEHHSEMQCRWQGSVARAILSHWDMSPEIVVAACEFERAASRGEGTADIGDVLYVAKNLASTQDVLRTAPARRLGLDADQHAELINGSREGIDSLRAALCG